MFLAVLAGALAATSRQGRTLNVFAAASLKEAFTAIVQRYEKGHPGLTIRLNFAGSQTLASQINAGADADVFASAAEKNLRDIGFDPESRRIFALNRLEIALRPGFAGIRTVRDLANVKNFVIADPAVPAGRYTEQFIKRAGIEFGGAWESKVRAAVVSREADVKSVLAKVKLGEADAGIVYVSDVATARPRVGEIPIPDKLNNVARYPVAIPSKSANRDEAKHFIKHILSADSQRVLEQCGFISPTRAVDRLLLIVGVKATTVPFPLPAKYRAAAVDALDEHKQRRHFRGVLVAALPGLGAAGKTATFAGADGYVQALSTTELKQRKAVLVRNADGNYQLIVPGLKPSVWVNWLREIKVR